MALSLYRTRGSRAGRTARAAVPDSVPRRLGRLLARLGLLARPSTLLEPLSLRGASAARQRRAGGRETHTTKNLVEYEEIWRWRRGICIKTRAESPRHSPRCSPAGDFVSGWGGDSDTSWAAAGPVKSRGHRVGNFLERNGRFADF